MGTVRDWSQRAQSAFRRLAASIQDTAGQTLAEYGIIITVVAVGTVVLALIAFRGALAGAYAAVTGCLDGSC
jgi:Flp pilus assembly pilin Flp